MVSYKILVISDHVSTTFIVYVVKNFSPISVLAQRPLMTNYDQQSDCSGEHNVDSLNESEDVKHLHKREGETVYTHLMFVNGSQRFIANGRNDDDRLLGSLELLHCTHFDSIDIFFLQALHNLKDLWKLVCIIGLFCDIKTHSPCRTCLLYGEMIPMSDGLILPPWFGRSNCLT